jgi:hypothetical protein
VGRILLRLGAVALITGVPAGVADARTADRARLPEPWATVNVCDTAGHPDGVGVRGWMAGSGRSDVDLQMRFRLQYRRGSAWVPVRGADSSWIDAGAGDQRAVEAGQTFTVTPPRAGRAYVLRGLVSFRWRARDGTVLRSTRKVTRGGHTTTAGAEPVGYSAATCTVR